MTPHNSAKKEDVAPAVLMCGDPLRAKWLSENYFENSKLINEVRGMFAYTGTYKGKRLTVMGHGMGIPSMAIYSWELFKFYGAEFIIRMGTTGSYSKDINVGNLVIAKDVFSYSNYASEIGLDVHDHIIETDTKLVQLARDTAKKLNLNAHVCRVFSSDSFYNKYTLEENIARSGNSEVVEMEAFALYANANKLGKKALALLTCSDSLVVPGVELSPEERQRKLSDMALLALNIACDYAL